MAAIVSKLEGTDPAIDVNYGVLPRDVLREILLRLPANEVCRLRLVCRPWRSITSEPVFAKAHLSRHPQVAALHEKRGRQDEVHVVDLSAGNVLKRMHLARRGRGLSAQHDLLCVSQGWGQAYVLNLATGTVVADTTSEHAREGNSAGTPTALLVLGQIPSTTGEYKVLHLQLHYDTSQTCETITVVSGGCDGTWRKRPCPPVTVLMSSVALVDGVAYFLANTNIEPGSIASFDMATEEWRPTTLQSPLLHASTRRNFMDTRIDMSHFRLAGGLSGCLVTVHCNYKDSSADLWFLVDADKPLWTKRYSMRYTPFGMYPRYYRPLVVLEDGRIAVFTEGARVIRAYDPRTSTWADLVKLKYYCAIIPYHGSLLCPGVHG